MEKPCPATPKVDRIQAASTCGSTGAPGCDSVNAASGEFVTGAVTAAESSDGSPGNESAVDAEALDDTAAATEAAQGVCGAPGCGAELEAAAVPAGGQVSPESGGAAAEELDTRLGDGASSSPARAAGRGDAKNCGWPPEAGLAAEDPVPSALGGAVWPMTPAGA